MTAGAGRSAGRERLDRERRSGTTDNPPAAGAGGGARRPDHRPNHWPNHSGVARLQRVAGNAAVSRLVVQRLRAGPSGPSSDPKFAALGHDVVGKQATLTAHRPVGVESAAAQAAARPPPDDKLAQGKVAQSGDMATARPGGFDKAAFVRAVNDAIAAQAPKNLDEADKYSESGKADRVKEQVSGRVGDGKKASAAAIDTATKAAPDESRAVDKHVTPLAPDHPPATPAAPNPAQAVPDRAPTSATDFSAGQKQVNDQMAHAGVTEEQLARSNEPEFTDALKDKKAGEAHAASAPGVVRGREAQTLAAAKAHAASTGAAAMNQMAAHRRAAGAGVRAGKEAAKGSDEATRARVTAVLQKVFDATKKDVEAILSGLDKKVDDQFTGEEKAARDAFTAEHHRGMDAYKARRYGGILGKGRWLKDKFMGLPEEANQIFVQARAGYVSRMRTVISHVADTIGAELGRAKDRIAKGRTDLRAEVTKLPPDLRAIGRQAAGDFAGRFDELSSDVDAKGQQLVQTLASKYTEALRAVDAEIAEEKEKNKGLVAKAVDAVKGVIDTILKLKDLLLGILARAASAVMAIIKDPIGFLGKLVSAVGAGLRNFIANIADHLKKGLVSWLLGAMASAGLQLPDKFDLRGIIALVANLLGLTWQAIRGRVVSRGVPDQAVTAAEKAVPEVELIQKEGLPGLWQRISATLGDIKGMILGRISAFLIPTVLIAGITWIISLLNPASAFVKAAKAIIDIVTFVVERGAQIIAFVNAVLDAVLAIAGGGTGGVPALIENALALSIPVLIGALAALLGVSGLANKVKGIVQALGKPVMKVVDWVVDKIVGLAKKLWIKLKAGARRAGRKLPGRDDSPAGKQQRLDNAMTSAVRAVNRFGGRAVGRAALRPVLAGIRVRYGLQSLELFLHGPRWAVRGVVNPQDERDTEAAPATDGWPPSKPLPPKPKIGSPGAAEWRYQRYRWQAFQKGKTAADCISFDSWKETYYSPTARGDRPGRRGGRQQVATKEALTRHEGVREVENVNLGGRFPDGIDPNPNAAGGRNYYEVGKMLLSGKPESRERVKLQDEINALGPHDTVTFVDKVNRMRRITYRRGDNVDTRTVDS